MPATTTRRAATWRKASAFFTLGHIFEQSITELECREGELEGREMVAKLSKRKRDGVYYTPEPVVNDLVERTLGPWFADAKAACGYPRPEQGAPTMAAARAYVERMKAIRIVDPACGSGAFLISAFRRLLAERIATAREAGGSTPGVIDETPLIAAILRDSIYGVDIKPASVEIAKLALWLHSARTATPLSSLEHTIRVGNSLVGEDFWAGRPRTSTTRSEAPMPTLLPARVAEAARPSDVPVFLAVAMTLVFLMALTMRMPANLEAQGLAGTIYAALRAGA